LYSLPTELLSSLQGVVGFDAAAFTAVHASGQQVTSIRLNPAKWPAMPEGWWGKEEGEVAMEKVPWSTQGFYLSKRPSFTFDPLFHAGTYYVQEASSMFLEQALRQTTDVARPLRVLDLCAAPGGKSTLIQSLLTEDSLLVSNEVIRSRAGILQENMTKWGGANVIVTNNDPRDLGQLENYFDVIVVDAPCSGSGLFRREPEAIEEWSPDNVQLCHQRQQRILADIWPALRKDGVLIYSTCSYSREEDEEILDWMVEELQALSCKLQAEPAWKIVESEGKNGGYGYRFYPDRLKGEGFFIAAVRKQDGDTFTYPQRRKPGPAKLSKKETEELHPWIVERMPLFLFRHEDMVRALPAAAVEDLSFIKDHCYLKKAGVLLGRPSVKEFIPEHELALSTVINPQLPAIDLSGEEAIEYLRKEDIRPAGGRGWSLVRYLGRNLGWVKVLPNRVNNYYPKEWRILKRP